RPGARRARSWTGAGGSPSDAPRTTVRRAVARRGPGPTASAGARCSGWSGRDRLPGFPSPGWRRPGRTPRRRPAASARSWRTAWWSRPVTTWSACLPSRPAPHRLREPTRSAAQQPLGSVDLVVGAERRRLQVAVGEVLEAGPGRVVQPHDGLPVGAPVERALRDLVAEPARVGQVGPGRQGDDRLRVEV